MTGIVAAVMLLLAWAGLADLSEVDRRLGPAAANDEQEMVDGVFGLALLPDGGRFVCYGPALAIHLADARTGAPVTALANLRSRVATMAASPDGRRLLTGHADGTVTFWSDLDGLPTPCHVAKNDAPVSSVAFSSDGRRIASASIDSRVQVWDAETLALQRQFDTSPTMNPVVRFAPGDERLVSGGSNGAIRIWDVETGRELQCLRGASWRILVFELSPDGRLIVSISTDGSIRACDARSGNELWRDARQSCSIVHSGLAFSPDAALLACADADGRLQLRESMTGQVVAQFQAHPQGLRTVRFLPDGRSLLSCGFDGFVCRWDIPTESQTWRRGPWHARDL